MKKSLSAIVSLAMAFSMFSSVAFGAEATTTTSTTTTATATAAKKTVADFKDLADIDAGLKAKIEALLAKGVFEGTSEDSFGIKENMTRAQFAKVLTLIYGVEVDMNVKASSFSDVKADDNANAWAIPFIEAAKKKGLIDGMTDSTFAPGENVTLGQFATALVKGLGKTVSTTGTPWYSDAIKQAVELKVLPEGVDGAKTATRADLVVGAYGGQEAYNAQTALSAEVKATGAKTVTVNFSKAVDTATTKIDLTKAGVAVVTNAKFADDKKSAVVTLTDTRLSAGTYKVTVTAGSDKIEKEFTAEDEKVTKIDFLTSGDTIAKATNVAVKIKASNQYGENASFSAGSYTYYGGAVTKITKNADGFLIATVDTSGQQTGTGIVTITITSTEGGNHVSATKNFTVGTQPILTKMELGSAKYSVGSALTGSGDNVKFALNFYDQYGSMMGYDALNIGASTGELKPTVIFNDYIDGAIYATEDDGNNNPVLKISLSKNVDKKGDYNFTVINQAATATGKFSVSSAKVATKVQIGQLEDVIAAGDTEAYIPVVAYDADGNQLSVEDLVKSENLNRIKVSVSGGVSMNGDKILESGENKGKIGLTSIAGTKNGVVSATAIIATANVSSSDTKNFTIQGARKPDSIKEATAPAKELVPGGSNKFKYQILDQYGKPLKNLLQVDSQGNVSTSGSNYSVTVSATTYDVSGTTPVAVTGIVKDTTRLNPAAPLLVTSDNDAVLNAANSTALFDGTTRTVTDLKGDLNDKTYRFAALNDSSALNKKIDLTIRILKDGTEITKLTRTATVTSAGTVGQTEVTYALNSVATLWNAVDADNTVVQGYTYDDETSVTAGTYTLSQATQLRADSKFGRELVVSAKNAAGESVGFPKQITYAASSDTNVAQVYFTTDSNGLGKAWVIGNKAGTANVQVTFKALDGTVKTLNQTVTVKNDALKVDRITWDEKSWNEDFRFNAFTGVNIFDNYGVEYADANGQKYNYVLGTAFTIGKVSSPDGKATVTVDKYGNVKVSHPELEVGGSGTLPASYTAANPVVFDLTINSANGKSATTTIYATKKANDALDGRSKR